MLFKSIVPASILVALLASFSSAQLVQKKVAEPTKAGSIDLTGGTKKQPLVYSDSVAQRNDKATSEAISSMDLEYSNDSLTGTLIGIGAEYVGQTVKNMLSPNSAEADAVELERTRR